MFNNKDNEDIFNFINKKDNDTLSLFKEKDIEKLKEYLKKYYLELRNNLGLKNNVTFGLELEFENSAYFIIEKGLARLLLQEEWKIKDDQSLYLGGEINSPILYDKKENWDDLKKVCDFVKKFSRIGLNSGGHIHIGTQVLGLDIESWFNFMKIWSVYENIIFRFLYGEYLGPRPSLINYAKPLKSTFNSYYQLLKKGNKDIESLIHLLREERYQAVNFRNVELENNIIEYNTIEFRCPNGTLNPIIWQNNVNLLVKLIEYTKNNNFNLDMIEKRENIDMDNYYSKMNNNLYYNNIFLDKALELADLIFDNNLDKIYFLRQYLKSFKDSRNRYHKSRTFTKR